MEGAEIAFSEYAAVYDEHFTSSMIGKLQRARVWKYLSKLSATVHPEVLEIGCGTGHDAKWMAEKGFRVTATDFSEGMVRVAHEKLKDHSRVQEISWCDAKDIPERFKERKFDVIFSNFGALNCVSPCEFQQLIGKLHLLLNPGGRIIFVLLSTDCKWEQKYFKRKRETEKAFRRKKKEGVITTIAQTTFRTWYYAPTTIRGMFGSGFRVNRLKPIGLFIPPSYLENYFEKHQTRLKILDVLEKLFSFSYFSDKADHYYIELELKS